MFTQKYKDNICVKDTVFLISFYAVVEWLFMLLRHTAFTGGFTQPLLHIARQAPHSLIPKTVKTQYKRVEIRTHVLATSLLKKNSKGYFTAIPMASNVVKIALVNMLISNEKEE